MTTEKGRFARRVDAVFDILEVAIFIVLIVALGLWALAQCTGSTGLSYWSCVKASTVLLSAVGGFVEFARVLAQIWSDTE